MVCPFRWIVNARSDCRQDGHFLSAVADAEIALRQKLRTTSLLRYCRNTAKFAMTPWHDAHCHIAACGSSIGFKKVWHTGQITDDVKPPAPKYQIFLLFFDRALHYTTRVNDPQDKLGG